MFCCGRKRRIETTEGLIQIRQQKNRVQARKFNTRNKLRCMFCGGKGCRHENYKRNKNPAIIGLHSDWIDDNIIASQRLSSRIIQQHDVLTTMKSLGVTTIVNT